MVVSNEVLRLEAESSYYFGRPVKDMGRDDLLLVIGYLAERLLSQKERHLADIHQIAGAC